MTKKHVASDENRAIVRALASFGTPKHDIARYLGIGNDTLYKHYGDEIKNAKVEADREVAEFLHRYATGKALGDGASHADCVRSAIFWAKTRMKWRENSDPPDAEDSGGVSSGVQVVMPDNSKRGGGGRG